MYVLKLVNEVKKSSIFLGDSYHYIFTTLLQRIAASPFVPDDANFGDKWDTRSSL